MEWNSKLWQKKKSLPDLCLKTGWVQHMEMTLERKVIDTPPQLNGDYAWVDINIQIPR